MGQSASRSHRQSPAASPRCADSTPNDPSSSHTSDQVSSSSGTPVSSTSAAKKSRRRSVLNFVSRSSSTTSSEQQDKDESPQRHSTSLRKRWRSSRRFSKAHASLEAMNEPSSSKDSNIPEGAYDHTHNELPITPVETQILAGPSHSSRPSTPFPTSRPTTPHTEAPSDVQAEGLSSEERQLSENIGNWLSGSPQTVAGNLHETETNSSTRPVHPDSVDIEREINELLSSHPETSGVDNASSGPSGASTETPGRPVDLAAPPQAPSRHFPPPGTLVVVQGVVNTTDAPQNSTRTVNTSAPLPPAPQSLLPSTTSQRRSSSAPRSSRSATAGEGSRRIGLSSLMPRPSSMISRRPSTSSRVSSVRGSNRDTDPPSSSGPIPVHAHESTSSSDSVESSSDDNDTATPTDSEAGGHTLSPGSIDVLGTLLSVAAAATAASLFSPGFSNSNHLNGPSPATGRPMSPTPTAGLGGFGGLNQLAELSLDHSPGTEPPPPPQTEPSQSDRDARDRIRGVWENFRDRLGLGARGASPGIIPAGPPTTGDEEPSTDRGYAQSARMRPGELMLAEMARALNAGLGLTGSSERRSSADQNMSSGADRAGGRASPQTTDAGERRPLSPDPGFEEFLTSLQADLRTVLSSHPPTEDAPSVPDHTRQSVSRLPQHDVDVPADVLPLADDDADSDVEEDTHPSPTPTERPMHHTRTPTPIPPPTTLPHVPSSDSEDENPPSGERRQPAINLWRVYRFPPIPAPPGHALRMSVLPQPGGPQESTPISPLAVPAAPGLDPSPYTRSAPSSATSLSSGPDQQPSAPQNVVVPVIVVGLQSVDTADRADFEDGSGMPQDEINGNDETDFETEDFSEPPHDSTANGRPATPRGRSWQSRAANALRGLRPGRRSSTGRRASESAGSRTFLIYVIGGYYPPNHHVVTGSDSLDSYEALWELADLLGQVKPPVATRDDIEKSGLEIVKASEMKHHEEEGRIASNCMERCLICLDDYEPEQNVRVMTCRHAFHKDCVDKWLQIGRNNCPACRSKGVSTSNDSTPPPPLPPHANPIL